MERIVIEVAKTTARKWRESSHPKRKKIANLLAQALKGDIKSLKRSQPPIASRNAAIMEASINETSLSKEWLSEEDSRWDDLLK